jgi:Kef-type K+ transport system membrane component KefB
MTEIEFFLKFFLILVTAKAMGEVFAQFRLPAVIGEVVAGIIIGPSLLNLIQPEATFLLLAKIGMLLLLFEVGVDTDVGKLISVGGQSVLVAVTGVVLPFGMGYYGGILFGLGHATSLFIGGTLVATSIGITLRVLKDLGRQHTMPAQVVLGSAVLDDVIGVVILAVLFDYTVEGRVDIASSVSIFLFIAIFLIAAPIFSRLLVTFMARVSGVAKTPGMLSTIVVALILILSVTAHDFGAPEIVGAFAAGLALTRKSMFNMGKYMEHLRTDIVTRAEEKMTSIGELFIPIFFVMIGVSIDFRVIDFGSWWFWSFAGAMLAISFFSKLMSGIWVKGPLAAKLTVGIAMVPRGEVGLIFAEIGHRNRVFDDAIYASMVFVVALTTLVAPMLMRYVLARADGPEGARV